MDSGKRPNESDEFVSPDEAAAAFERWVWTQNRNELLRKLFPEGIRRYDHEKVVLRIRRHFPEVSRAEVYKMTPGELVPYLAGVLEAETSSTAIATPHVDDDMPLSAAKLADRLGIAPDDAKKRERVRKKLERWRKANLDGGWIETRDPKPREPKYLYPLGKVWRIISSG